jgi:long-chain acyl-CoA synthetase
MTDRTIVHALFDQAVTRPDAPAFHVRRADRWEPTTWRAHVREIRRLACAMIALGCEPGFTTCILGFNRPEWVQFDVATMAAGGAPAGIYTTSSVPEVEYIVQHARAKLVLVENQAQLDKLLQARERLPDVQHVILMRGSEAPAGDGWVLSWEAFLACADRVRDEDLDRRMNALQKDQLATLIYTSGTTGPPKGVMLSHGNLLWTARTAIQMVHAGPDDCALSYLPLSHIAEQMFSIHGPAVTGYALYFAESLEALRDNLVEVQPTIFFGVPRVWEKFYTGIRQKLDQAQGVRKSLAAWAMGVGEKVSDLRYRGQEPTGLLKLQYLAAHRLVFSKLKPAIGLGRAKVCVSGAAPIAPEVLSFFGRLDLRIQEVYGQSEGCGPTSFNVVGNTRLGTVGQPIPGCEVRIAEDGEILARGPNIFLGYYRDDEATQATLIDGWLHSGDLGELRDGFLSITGRKKDIIITAGGKNIAPKNIENDLKQYPLINEAVVIGDRRKYLTVLLTLDPETSAAFAREHGIPEEALTTHAVLLAAMQQAIDEVNRNLARVEQVKKFTVLPRNLTIDDNELTPTLKVKRSRVAQNWAHVIDAMYDDDESLAPVG